MYFKVLVLTFAAVSVSGRPQFGIIFPQRQLQFVQIEGTVFSDSFVRNRAAGVNGRQDAAANQFLNTRSQEIHPDVRETTPKLEAYTESNTEVFVSTNLNQTGDDRKSEVTITNAQFDDRKLNYERNSAFVNTNESSKSIAKDIVRPLQTNNRRKTQNKRHKEGICANNTQNLPPNMTNFDQNLHRNTVTSPRPLQNTQIAQNNNINSNLRPDTVSDIVTNPEYDSTNQTQTDPDYRSNGDIDDQSRRTVSNIANVSNGSPSNSSFGNKPATSTSLNHGQVEMTDDHEEDDRWIWGYSNVTEKGVTGTTPDLDDRANFDGGSCPTGQAKIGNKCVDKD